MASKYLQKFPVPNDFPEMLHDFAREVLRDQPQDIYEYGALYFRAMYEVSIFSLSFLLYQPSIKLTQRIFVTYPIIFVFRVSSLTTMAKVNNNKWKKTNMMKIGNNNKNSTINNNNNT